MPRARLVGDLLGGRVAESVDARGARRPSRTSGAAPHRRCRRASARRPSGRSRRPAAAGSGIGSISRLRQSIRSALPRRPDERRELIHDPDRHSGGDALRLLARLGELDRGQRRGLRRRRARARVRPRRLRSTRDRRRAARSTRRPRRVPRRATPALGERPHDSGRVAGPSAARPRRVRAAVGRDVHVLAEVERASRARRRPSAGSPARGSRGRSRAGARTPRCSPCGRRSG